MGLDPRAVQSATDVIMAGQKKAAMEYVDFWSAALNKREASEIATANRIKDETLATERAKNTASIAMARARVAEELAMQKAAAVEAAEIQGAGNVSGGFGSIESNIGKTVGGEVIHSVVHGAEFGAGAAGTGYAFNKAGKLIGAIDKDGKIIKGAEEAGKGLAEVGKEAHVNSTAIRETFVLIREGLRGNFTRMIGSFSILAQSLKVLGSVLAGLAFDIPVIIYGGVEFFRMRAAIANEKLIGKNVESQTHDNAESNRRIIEAMQRAGILSESDAQNYSRVLMHPTQQNVGTIQRELSIKAQGMTLEQIKLIPEIKKEMARLDKEHQKKMFEFYHADADIHTRLLSDEIQRHNIMEAMAELQKDSIAYKQKQLELDDANRAIQQDQTELAKQKAEADKTAAEKQAEMNNQATNLSRRIGQNDRELAQQEAVYPTIEDLAGRRFTRRLSRAYGAGGRFDLGSGNGWLAQTAQDYERSKYQQQYDRTYGNLDAAEGDRQRMIADRNFLIKSEAASPQLQFEKMLENTDAMRAHLQSLVGGGAVINTKITEDDL